jgi:hypothetical protein
VGRRGSAQAVLFVTIVARRCAQRKRRAEAQSHIVRGGGALGCA